MACKYIYKGVTYDSKEEFVEQIAKPLANKQSLVSKPNKFYRVVNVDLGNETGFLPTSFTEQVEDYEGKHRLVTSKYGGFKKSQIPETSASKSIGAALMGNWSASNHPQTGTFYVYEISDKPDIDLSDQKIFDFGQLQEVRYRKSVNGKLIGTINLTPEIVNLFNENYNLLTEDGGIDKHYTLRDEFEKKYGVRPHEEGISEGTNEKFNKFQEDWYKKFNNTLENKLQDIHNKYDESFKQSSFLQLLNKDNNWVTFFVKSIIQDSAKKGYEKLLFPSGNTASKIEGHTTLEEFKKQKEDRIKELEKQENDNKDKIGTKRKTSLGEYIYSEENYKEDKENINNEINQLKQELERVETEGFAALRPIYNFYENTVANILKKQGYNPIEITDEYGNKWNEVTLNQARDLANILLQRNEANQIIGQANIKAMTVLIDAVNQRSDTIPHEYAHHYIAWFRNTPIVQEAIKKWGSEEALVQSIGEQVVKQKGEAYNWWNKFVKWIMNQFNSLSKLQKEELTQILTDAFLTRQDLGSKADIQGFKDFVQGNQFQKLTAEEKAKTIERITKEQNNSLFGLNTQNQEQLEFHVNTLGVVSQFLENAGIETRLIPEFLSQDGSVVNGALAAANFIEGTVDIIDDLNKGRAEAWNKLPEEAAHWWYRLLNENSTLKKALWESHQTALKNNELYKTQYGKLVKSPSDLTEESIGQLIAEAIKRIETKNANSSDYSFFKKFLEWINSVLDIFKTTQQDPFEVAAMKILSSDMSDLMTWEEYRKLNNIVNFSDVLTEQSVIDYSQFESVSIVDTEEGIRLYAVHDSPYFDSEIKLKGWIKENKNRIQEVRDNQIFFDRLLNKTFRKKSKFLPKTLRKYFDIIDAQNLNPLSKWNISQELQQITKKLTPEEKRQIVETNGYTNIAPTLKVLPDLLQKYRKNPIVLSEPVKIDGAKKQELSILNGIREMIKLENPNLKSITAEEFVNEAHNWLETNYLLGFANENSYLSYRTDQTFKYLSDRQSNEDVDIANLTEEEIQRLPLSERQRIANIVGLTKQNPDVYHNKVSLRFNDMYHLKSGHFQKSPSAWGNLTYFYTGKNKWKDAVLLHEIQNDNIEFLREFKTKEVDLETSLGRYLQQLNTDLLDNITQIESGGKQIIKRDSSEEFRKTHLQLNYQLLQLKDLPLEQGLVQLKERLNEQIELHKSVPSKNPELAQEAVDKAYSQRRIFQDFQKRGGIKSLLTKEELQNLEELLKRLNTEEVEGETQWLPEENQFEPGFPSIRDLRQKKADFKFLTANLQNKINDKINEIYGTKSVKYVSLFAPAKPLPKSQRNMRTVGHGQNQRRIGGASQELNENANWLLTYSEKKILDGLSKTIEESKKNYIIARNATNGYNFNVSLSKITPEQYATLIENYKYNEDLLNRLIDEQAQKDIKQSSNLQTQKENDLKTISQINPKRKDTPGIKNWVYQINGNTFKTVTKQEAIEDIETYYDKDKKVGKQNKEFETLKQKALDKKAELEKNYGKIEEEVKQTLEIEMNYFTPLVHHLIQKHINQYGKDFPMYFSGYNITKLTQGNDRTAMIYAGKDEINIVDKSNFTLDKNRYEFTEGSESWQKSYYKGSIDSLPENDENIDEKEYEKAYQQATERRAKEIKFEAAQQIGIIPLVSYGESVSLEEGIKKLNEYKRQSKQNMDRVINTIMNISNNKPIETGAIFNAMSQVNGVKLIWQDKIDGLKNNSGGYLVDLSNYNYNTPILYGLNTSKAVPINPNLVDNSEIQYSKRESNSNTIDRLATPYSQMLEDENTDLDNVLKEKKLLEYLNKQIKYIDEEGNECAEFGLKTGVSGTNWRIEENLNWGKKHSEGGIDLTMTDDGIVFRRNNSDIRASHGLVIKAEDGIVMPDQSNIDGEDPKKPPKYPKSIKIKDGRVKNPITGKPFNGNKSGDYDYLLMHEVVHNAKKYGIDPYNFLAMAMQETTLGKAGGGMTNPFHILNSSTIESKMDKKRYSEYFKNKTDRMRPVEMAANFYKNVKLLDMPKKKNPNIQDDVWDLQSWNGYGSIYPTTEQHIDGGGDRYGVSIPKEGINMSKNPMYGIWVKDLSNIFRDSKEVNDLVTRIYGPNAPAPYPDRIINDDVSE